MSTGAPCGQRLDVHGQPDREQRQLGVLGEVVADHREAGGVAGVVVDQAAAGVARRFGWFLPRNPGVGARGRARVLRIHREAVLFLGGQALALGLPSRRGPSYVCGCCGVAAALSVGAGNRLRNPAELAMFTRESEAACRAGGGVGFGGVLSLPGSLGKDRPWHRSTRIRFRVPVPGGGRLRPRRSCAAAAPGRCPSGRRAPRRGARPRPDSASGEACWALGSRSPRVSVTSMRRVAPMT